MLIRRDGTVAWAVAPNCLVQDIVAFPAAGALILGDFCNINEIPQNDRTPIADDPILFRLNGRGDAVWARQLHFEPHLTLSGTAIGGDDSIYVSAYSPRPHQRSYSNGNRLRADMLLIKLDPDGNLLWSRQIWTETGDRAVGLSIGDDGRPIVLGYDGLVAKVDNAGGLVWARQLQRQSANSVTTIGVAPSGDGAIIGGNSASLDRLGLNALAVGIDGGGDVAWTHEVDAGPSDRIEQAVGDGEGGAVLIGSTHRAGPTLEDKVHRMDGWLFRLDRAGHVVGSITVGGDYDDFLSDAAAAGLQIAAIGSAAIGRDRNVPVLIEGALRGSLKGCSEVSSVSVSTRPSEVIAVESAAEIRHVEVEIRSVDISLAPAAVDVLVRCGPGG